MKRNPSVLVIEDNVDLALSMKHLLDFEEIPCEVVFSGAEAATRLTTSDYDLFIIDMNLPDSRGDSLFLDIKALRPDARCLIISGYTSIDHLKTAAKIDGVIDCYTKPMDPAWFISKIKDELSRLPGEDHGARGAGNVITPLEIQESTPLKAVSDLHSRKLETLGKMTAEVAHDFNNMIAIIMGSATQALQMTPENSPLKPELLRIVEASKKARSRISALLGMAKASDKPALLNPSKIVRDTISLFEITLPDNISISTDIRHEVPFINANQSDLTHALMNVLNNARDAMLSSGGILHIECSSCPVESVPGNADIAGSSQYCRIAIHDDGTGISEDAIHSVFEPFFSTKLHDDGTGLGLSATRDIIGRHNGIIKLDSAMGKGTTVSIYLPSDL